VVEALGIGIAVGVVAAWIAFGALLAITARRNRAGIATVARVFPDTLRLLYSLARDRSLPNAIRWRLGFALIYCGQPFNLIPDFIPVIGYADNVVVAAWALRSVVRLAGPDAIKAYWAGSGEGLGLLYRALRIPIPGGGPVHTDQTTAAHRG
jgi:uncharacterized membrane protein YkvA (DUF1232 family)